MQPIEQAITDGFSCDFSGRLFLFPVRHHSPAAALLARAAIREYRPEIVLIEGPSDFNPRMTEMQLPHEPPIAIYSYVRSTEGLRRGAYYPFCEYSPEWQAIKTAAELNIETRFIDIPWAELAAEPSEPAHRYSDGHFVRNRYIRELCNKCNLENFDSLWDAMFEADPALTLESYLARMNRFCIHSRILEAGSLFSDRKREAFMAARIREAMDNCTKTFVLIGGYHSLALRTRILDDTISRLFRETLPDLADPHVFVPADAISPENRGIALSPYSYERLDSLKGYEAGMPNPGFYDRVWKSRSEGKFFSHRELLDDVILDLRHKKQTISTADLIALETTAAGLAALRGRKEVWRDDLVDGVVSALLKDDLALGCEHPFLNAVHSVLRGSKRGRLAEGASAPPLLRDVIKLLETYKIKREPRKNDLVLDLLKPAELEVSRFLHRLLILKIPGFDLPGPIEFYDGEELDSFCEQWMTYLSDDFHARLVEAAIYGSNLEDAAGERLLLLSAKIERNAAECAKILLDASLAGLHELGSRLFGSLEKLIEDDGDFVNVSGSLEIMLYLYKYDTALGTANKGEYAGLLRTGFDRALRLLDGAGNIVGNDRKLVDGIILCREIFRRCEDELSLDKADFLALFRRIEKDASLQPLIRGAAAGLLCSMGDSGAEQTAAMLKLFTEPEKIGDFLAGFFGLARESAQREPTLIGIIDDLLMGFNEEEFMNSLPSLRLAFSWFTPREKRQMAHGLVNSSDGHTTEEILPELTVTPTQAAAAMLLESKVYEIMEKYHFRSSHPSPLTPEKCNVNYDGG